MQNHPHLCLLLDHRIVGGGMDEEIEGLEKDKKKSRAKAEAIAQEIGAVFPHLDIKVSHEWNALFGKSKRRHPFHRTGSFKFQYLLSAGV